MDRFRKIIICGLALLIAGAAVFYFFRKHNETVKKDPTLINLHNADADQTKDYRSLLASGIYTIFDIDLQRTADGVYLNLHNPVYRDKTVSETASSDFDLSGDDAPMSFRDILSLAKEKHCILQIESKCGESAEILSDIAGIVNEYDMMDSVYYSKNSYAVLDAALDHFRNVMVWDTWQPACTPDQAEALLKKAEAQGGKVIINTSLDYKEPLTPEEAKAYKQKGFLIEIGMNHTENNAAAFEKLFRTYGPENIFSVKIDDGNYNFYRSGYEMLKH